MGLNCLGSTSLGPLKGKYFIICPFAVAANVTTQSTINPNGTSRIFNVRKPKTVGKKTGVLRSMAGCGILLRRVVNC